MNECCTFAFKEALEQVLQVIILNKIINVDEIIGTLKYAIKFLEDKEKMNNFYERSMNDGF